MDILFDGIVLDPCGFGVVNRNILLTLKNNGFNIKTQYSFFHTKKSLISTSHLDELTSLEFNKISSKCPIIISFPVGFSFLDKSIKKLCETRYVIFFTMTEVSELNDDIINEIKLADEIWVPTDFDLEKFKKYHDRVFKINLSADIATYNKNVAPNHELKEKCNGLTFLFSGSGIYRKGLIEACDAYIKSFTKQDDVTLVILSKEICLDEIYKKLNIGDFGNLPDIILLDKYFHEDEMPSIYSCADVLVLPSRGEGWSLPAIEFGSMGKPSIITNAGGQLEFLNNNGAWLLDVEKYCVDDKMYSLYKTNQYKNIKFPLFDNSFIDNISKCMLEAYSNRNLVYEKGKYIEEKITKNFNSKKLIKTISNRLSTIKEELDTKSISPKNTITVEDVNRESRKEKFINFKYAIETNSYFKEQKNVNNHFRNLFTNLKKFFLIVDDFNKFKLLYRIITLHPEIYCDPFIFDFSEDKFNPNIMDLTLAKSNKIFYYDAWLRYSLKKEEKIILGGVIDKNEFDINLLNISNKILATCEINNLSIPIEKIFRVNYTDIYDMDKINSIYQFLGVVQKTKIIK